jgi:hypothetical protein
VAECSVTVRRVRRPTHQVVDSVNRQRSTTASTPLAVSSKKTAANTAIETMAAAAPGEAMLHEVCH